METPQPQQGGKIQPSCQQRKQPVSSNDEGAANRNNSVNGVMGGGTLERPQGRKAAKADMAAKRRSKKMDDDEAETEAAAAFHIADSFHQNLTNWSLARSCLIEWRNIKDCLSSSSVGYLGRKWCSAIRNHFRVLLLII
jgi:hypothetical protein